MRRIPIGILGAVLASALTIPAAFAQAAPTIQITSPADGAKITSTNIPVTVAISNFKVDCSLAGAPNQPGVGHWHFMLDGGDMAHLTNFYCDNTVSISGEGVKAGPHTLMAVLSNNDHTEVGKPVQVKIDYEPTTASALPAAQPGATPTIKITSPADGATLSDAAHVTMQFAVTGFTPSTDLEGKPNVAGFGHIHVFVLNKPMDMGGGMMSMGGMVGMPGSSSTTFDLSKWPSGKYMLVAMLVGNDHNPIQGAMPAEINVTLQSKVAGAATLPKTGGSAPAVPAAPFAAVGIIALLAGGWVWRRSASGSAR
ncbi:MAG: hypothetical protein KGJ86_03750 [Chloroflexota bacterium]|nr:hypothetical protein [Chloroflexota bacterium]